MSNPKSKNSVNDNQNIIRKRSGLRAFSAVPVVKKTGSVMKLNSEFENPISEILTMFDCELILIPIKTNE